MKTIKCKNNLQKIIIDFTKINKRGVPAKKILTILKKMNK